ncbi:TIM barrel protein [Agrobacterium rhizogenes]|uniref:TIM barrel protein n=1 Tax=Rhizobium rhizogenes TaxID=359 RepID=UPI000645CFF4|nr:TIM barrel protein [Rhizobium rhizogenes]OCJ01618.1 xylose isomerase [Agrobacterium sp. 13-626]OCJ19331.1 xylose isomerase [Agrobacterium sp. B133/95]MQB30579.1 xylose isomerase [Rhizobium rhizogenes]NTF72122.1 TIM barrel protein [Rhizobium rhizogenes]NTG44943.1 TIM barrel protein [Rhizobium rhizogenes]
MSSIRFALNHMCAPSLSLEAFFSAAKSLGIDSVEIRNDLAGNAIIDGTPAAAVKALAAQYGLTIISINALQRFNEWNEVRAQEAAELIDYARDCGAKALVLVPVNDGSGREPDARQRNLLTALTALKPMLNEAGIIGLVEPLGFEICSLSSKTEAAAAIKSLGAQSTFRLVHDTFHHHLAGETATFPELTGLVHISGVSDPAVSVSDMLDAHRVLVDANDRLDNAGQIRALLSAGYAGPFSFEPFAADVHALKEPVDALRQSMAYLSAQV